MRRRRDLRRVVVLGAAGVLCLAGCGNQSTLSPDSHAAHDISSLWWGMLAGSALLFAVVVALLAFGLAPTPRPRTRIRTGRRTGTWLVAVGGFDRPARRAVRRCWP